MDSIKVDKNKIMSYFKTTDEDPNLIADICLRNYSLYPTLRTIPAKTKNYVDSCFVALYREVSYSDVGVKEAVEGLSRYTDPDKLLTVLLHNHKEITRYIYKMYPGIYNNILFKHEKDGTYEYEPS